ncbi:M3 family metallopeptidase [Thalassotalea aquiviva]|uniref:M3 family metallopeptidase n=1 Tax=Thalassotalea aquiviva TaxID=3242415 RepID=UPI00352A0F76
MRKAILTIKRVLLVGLLISCTSSANEATLKQFWLQDIEASCQQVVNQVEQFYRHYQVLSDTSFSKQFQWFEQGLLQAHNALFSSYLVADVVPDLNQANAGKACQPRLISSIDTVLASTALANLLKHTQDDSKSLIEQRVWDKYATLHQQLTQPNYLSLKAKAKVAGDAFRQTTTQKPIGQFDLPQHCQQGLDESQQSLFSLIDGRLRGQLSSSRYRALVDHALNSACRKLAFSQYQSRHLEQNQANLLTFIAIQTQRAQALGFHNFAEFSLQNTSFGSISQVDQLLKNLVKQLPQAKAPWDANFQQDQPAVKAKTKTKLAISPALAISGLFWLLDSQFNLQVSALEQPTWHPSVDAYQLKRGDKVLGHFYLDLYPRPGKYPKNRHRALQRGIHHIQLPSSALILNLPEKSWRQRHLKSLFHEFGHLLHNLLAVSDYHIVAGISLENDLIEMPAKWFEWLSFSESLQKQMFNKVIVENALDSQSEVFRMRLYRAAMALHYFATPASKQNIENINAKLASLYWGHDYAKGASSQYSFSHLATYGPRYYNYIWSEMMAKRLLDDYYQKRFSGTDFFNAILSNGGQVDIYHMLSHLYQCTLTPSDILVWIANEKSL